VALQQAATDPVTGAIDMDLIQTGVSASERIARAQLAQEIKALLLGARLRCPPATLKQSTLIFCEQLSILCQQHPVLSSPVATRLLTVLHGEF
jgi:hypothetical protein